MTITTDTNAPLFAVVGATGTQGTSVIKAIQESSTAYRVRGLTRDSTKPKAQALSALGVHVVSGSMESKDELEGAFAGATYVFAMTTGMGDEVQHGKNQVDAALAANVKVLFWAGLSSLSDFTDGKYPCRVFDQKAKVTAYARTLATPSFRVIDVQAPSYLSNYWTQNFPRKQEDGSFHLVYPSSPASPVPILDMEADFGEYVVGALERGGPEVETVYAAPEYTFWEEHAAIFSKVLGKTIKTVEIPRDVYIPAMAAHVGDFAVDVYNMFQAIQSPGYWNGADLAASNALLRRPARSFEEGVRANKEKLEPLYQ